MTRREFCSEYLKRVAIGAILPALSARSVFAQASPSKHLVIVQLFGGNDGLNTVAPLRNPLYATYRPTLAVPAALCYPLNPDYGLNPALSSFQPMWEGGNLAVVQGVGHPLSDRSHFTSTSIWETANLGSSPDAGTGWLGRYLDALDQPPNAPALALTASINIPQTLTAITAPISAVDDLDAFRLESDALYPADRASLLSTLGAVLDAKGSESPNRAFVRQSAIGALRDVDLYQNVNASYRAAAVYPDTPIGKRLGVIARMIAGGAPPRVHFATQEGYDHHAALLKDHPARLTELNDALNAFCKDLKAHGAFKEVTIATFSEFGRRVKENAAQGTDHGHGSVLFVLGGSVRGGMYGTYPSLEPQDLVDGDLKQTVDFRRVYATLLDKWLGADADTLLGQRFERLGFL